MSELPEKAWYVGNENWKMDIFDGGTCNKKETMVEVSDESWLLTMIFGGFEAS
jgi:hypothetical protein